MQKINLALSHFFPFPSSFFAERRKQKTPTPTSLSDSTIASLCRTPCSLPPCAPASIENGGALWTAARQAPGTACRNGGRQPSQHVPATAAVDGAHRHNLATSSPVPWYRASFLAAAATRAATTTAAVRPAATASDFAFRGTGAGPKRQQQQQ